MDEDRFEESILPVLENSCFDCHAGGGEEGGVTFDHLVEDENPAVGDPVLWNRVLKQLRTGLMPPPDAEELEPEQKVELESWIIDDVFRHDPENPDPGHVTVRRLNREEYRNTIRDLLKIDFNTSINFPPDDSGEGFDNIGDVLTISPMLMEKYIDAAQTIANKVVPQVGMQTPLRRFTPQDFNAPDDCIDDGRLALSFYKPRTIELDFKVDETQQYSLDFTLVLAEDYIENATDANRCEVKFFLDDEELVSEQYERDPWKRHPFEFAREISKGEHSIRIEVIPLTKEEWGRDLKIRFEDMVLRGPLGEDFWVVPKKHAAFFKKPIPDSDEGRMEYAEELIRPFLRRAQRRAPDDETVQRLCELAQRIWQKETGSFEQGIQQAMVAVLASPRFLFREEFAIQSDMNQYALIDEFSLASRLSYFLWSSMPDEELLKLAEENRLRENLDAQIVRMKKDKRFRSFYRNFVGQWLQARDVEGVPINSFSVLLREAPDPDIQEKFLRYGELKKKQKRRLTEEGKKEREALLKDLRPIFKQAGKIGLSAELRRAMRRETEMLVQYIVEEGKDVAELIDCNYTFLNERLAKHYGIENVKGREMRRVELPEGSLRGGLLGHGSMLAVTSNPDRTSPVKRGLFLLDNVLGIPTGAPPPDIPSLEESESAGHGKRLTLREALAVHRESALCSSCHNRMDPLGLALENFDPLGRERPDKSIDVSGELVTGEQFENLNQLKKILATNHKDKIYHCVAEKMLMFALGRSLEYYDVPTVDQIVERVKENNGSGSEMLNAVIESVAFQRMRHESGAELSKN
ncbi:DUF1592 domain-containing protein [Mariniblastus fucicola]|uniref:DUF1592 domain-containing protein n=1 Tax=Mariniblastus fucicola TaxID=980251 RepID=UPI00138FCB2D|nr:DUF1592 domain-containing protein [Mariniblastus fucicola]